MTGMVVVGGGGAWDDATTAVEVCVLMTGILTTIGLYIRRFGNGGTLSVKTIHDIVVSFSSSSLDKISARTK
eukprot:CAMPEP_0194154020 /NCGR_PEP_ID=MMETSP0152-20130528/58843_1 /TAXON_ID=1049557 /ORGANISM="Thalassiothrix antarctica, Strain L6-D1" /LENGTH=71 /DNA_ID=CAMNT_0038859775 /DNA_START=46 /DNA_END=261 /DNA_ORIENTATION=-